MSAERKKLILAIAVIFAANIFIIALVQYASADLYKRGSSGDMVREIQTRLKNWGYYSGAVAAGGAGAIATATGWHPDGVGGPEQIRRIAAAAGAAAGPGAGAGSGSIGIIAVIDGGGPGPADDDASAARAAEAMAAGAHVVQLRRLPG